MKSFVWISGEDWLRNLIEAQSSRRELLAINISFEDLLNRN